MIAHVGEELGPGLDRVDVVAVQLFGLVAAGRVVGLEAGVRLVDHVAVIALEQVELASRSPA